MLTLRSGSRACLQASSLLILVCASANAQDFVWNGSSNDWSTASNWTGGVTSPPDTSSERAIFNGATGSTPTTHSPSDLLGLRMLGTNSDPATLDGNLNLAELTLASSNAASVLTTGANTITVASGGTLTLASNTTLNANSGGLTFAGTGTWTDSGSSASNYGVVNVNGQVGYTPNTGATASYASFNVGSSGVLTLNASMNLGAANLTVAAGGVINLNGFSITTTGSITNNGTINGVAYTWNGATNSDWATASNWAQGPTYTGTSGSAAGAPGSNAGQSDTVVFNATANAANLDSARTVENLTVTPGYTGALALNAFDLTVSSGLSLNCSGAGTFAFGANTLSCSGTAVSLAGNVGGGGGGSLSLSNAGVTLTMAGAATLDATLNVPTAAGVTFAGAGPYDLDSLVTAGTGSVSATTGQVICNGAFTLGGTGSYTQRTTGINDTVVGGNVSVAAGVTFAHGGGELRINTGTPTLASNGVNLGRVQTDVNVTLTSATTVSTLTALGGTFSTGAQTLTVAGNGTTATPLVVAGTLAGSGTVLITAQGTGDVQIPSAAYNNLTLTPAAAQTYELIGNLVVAGALTVSANATLNTSDGTDRTLSVTGGTTVAGALDLTNTSTFTGAFAISDGGAVTCTRRSVVLTFNGGVTVGGGTSGSMTFNSSGVSGAAGAGLDCVFAEGSTLNVQAGATLSITGKATNGHQTTLRDQNGAAGSPDGTPWNLTPTGTVTINACRVQDSSALGAGVTASNSVNEGSNTNWTFSPKTTRWTPTSSANWSDGANWSNGLPGAEDVVEFDNVGTGDCSFDVTGGVSIGSLNMDVGSGYSGTLQIDHPLTVTGNAMTRGTLTVFAALRFEGASNMIGGSYNVANAVTVPNPGVLTLSSGLFLLNPGSSLNVASANLTLTGNISHAGTSLTLGGNVTGNGTLGGTGDVFLNGVSINLSNVTTSFTGGTATVAGATATKTLTVDTANDSFNNLTINNPNGVNVAGTRLVVNGTPTANLVVQAGNLVLTNQGALVRNDLAVTGTLTGSGGLINVGRNVNFTGSTAVDLTSTPTTLVLDGAGAQSVTSAGRALGPVTVSNTSPVLAVSFVGATTITGDLLGTDFFRVSFPASAVTRVTGNMSFSAAAAEDLTLAGTGAVLQVGGNLNLTNLTSFTHNNNRVECVLGATSTTITPNALSFGPVVVSSGSAGNAAPMGCTSFTLNGGSWGGAAVLNVSGLADLNGGALGVSGGGPVNFNGQTNFDGSSVSVDLNGILDLNGEVTSSGGTLVVGGPTDPGRLNASGLNVNFGGLTANLGPGNNGTLSLDRGSPQTLVPPTLGTGLANTVEVHGATSATLSTNPLRAGSLTFASGGATLTTAGNNVILSGNLVLDGILDSSGGGTVSVGGNFLHSVGGGTLNLGSNGLAVAGQTVNFSSLTTLTQLAGSTITLNRTVDANPVTLTPRFGGAPLRGLVIARNASADSVIVATSALNLLGATQITTGTLLVDQDTDFQGPLTIASDGEVHARVRGRTLTFRSGVTLAGTLRLQPTTGAGQGLEAIFFEGTTLNVTGSFLVTGELGLTNNVQLRDQDTIAPVDNGDGTPWNVTQGGTITVSRARIQDSTLDVLTAATFSTDEGGNTNWQFTPSPAVTTWTGAVNGSWNNAGNWDNGIPSNGATVLFDATSAVASINDIPGTLALLDFVINGHAAAITLSNSVTITNDATWNSGVVLLGSTLGFLGNATLSGSLSLSGQTMSVAGNLAMPAGSLDTGAGTLSVTGTSDIDGTLTLGNGGTITLTGDVLTGSNGTLTDAANVGTLNLGGAVIDATSLALTPNGSAVNFTGAAPQTLRLGGGEAFGATTVGASGVTLVGNALTTTTLALNGTLNTGSQNVTPNGTLTVGAAGTLEVVGFSTVAPTGALAGTGTVTQSGASTIRLTAASLNLSTFASFTSAVGTRVEFSGAAPKLVTLGPAVTFGHVTVDTGNVNFLGAALDVDGNLLVSGGPTLVLGNFANDVAGGLTINSPSSTVELATNNAPLHVGADLFLQGQLLHDTGDLNVDGNVSGVATGVLSSTGGTVTLGGATLDFLSPRLSLSGTSTLVLDGPAAQTLTLGNGGLADTIQNLTIDTTGGASFGATTQAVTIAGALTVNDPLLFSSNAAGDVSAGSLVLSAGNATDVLDVNGRDFTINGGAVALTQGVLEVDGGITNLGAGALTTSANASVSQTGGQIDLSATSLPLSTLGGFSSTAGVVRLTGNALQTLSVANTRVAFTNLTVGVTAGGNVTLAGDQLTVSNDLTLTAGRNLSTGTTNLVVGNDLNGSGSGLNAATSTLVQVGRNLDVGAYTPGALLRFSGNDNATWTRAGGSNFGAVEVSGSKTVSLSPASGAAAWSTAGITVNSSGTLDMNGNPLSATALTVGGASNGTLGNGVAPVRSLTVAGNVDLGANSAVTSGFRIDLGITAPGSLALRGVNTVFNGIVVSTGGTVSGTGAMQVGAGGFYLNGGSLTWDANDLLVAGNCNLSAGTVTLSPTSTLTVAPTAAPAFLVTNDALESNLRIGGFQLVTLTGPGLEVGNGVGQRSDFTINAGARFLAGANMRVWGNTLVNGEWILTQPGVVVSFGDGQSATWGATSNVHLDSNTNLSFLSTVPGTTWNLAIQPGATFDLDSGVAPFPAMGLRVRDSDATASPQTPLTGATGVGLGNTFNWPDLQIVQATWTGLGAAGNWADAGNWTPAAPVIGGGVIFDTANANLPTTNSPTFALGQIQILGTWNGAVTLDNDLSVNGNLTLSGQPGAALVTNSQALTVVGTIGGTQTLTATGSAVVTRGLTVTTYTAGTSLTFQGSGPWSGASNFGPVVVNGAVTTTTLGSTVSSTSLEVNNGATLNLNANTATVAGDVTLGSAGDGALSGAVNSRLQLTGNYSVLNSSTIAPTITSTFAGGAQTFTPRPQQTSGHVQVNAGSVVTLAAGLGVGSLDVNGTLNGVAFVVSSIGTVDLSGGTFSQTGAGTLVMDGPGSRSLFLGGNTLNNLTTATATHATQVENTLVVSGVTSVGAGSTLRVKPGASATFNGTLNLAGTLDICADTTFNAALTAVSGGTLTATSASNATIAFDEALATTFPAGSAFTVSPSGGTVELRSTVLGDRWDFVVGGTISVNNARVRDGNASANVTTVASVDFGNNSATWLGLIAPNVVWTAGGGNANWADPLNYDLGVAPSAGSRVTFSGAVGFSPQLSSPTQLGEIVVTAGYAPAGAAPIRLTQDLVVSGGLDLDTNATATVDCGGFTLSARGASQTLGIPVNNGTLRFDPAGNTNLALPNASLTLGAALEVGAAGSGTRLSFTSNTNDLVLNGALGVDTGSVLDVDGVTGVDLDLQGDLTLVGTAQALLGPNQLNAAGNVTTAAGGVLSFTGAGRLSLDGATQTLDLSGNVTLRRLNVASSTVLAAQNGALSVALDYVQTGSMTLQNTVTGFNVSGAFTATAGTLTLNNVPVVVSGTWNSVGATVNPGTGTGLVTFNSGVAQTLAFGPTTRFRNLTLNSGSTLTLMGGATPLPVTGNLRVEGGGTLLSGPGATGGLTLGGDLGFAGGSTLNLAGVAVNAPLTVQGNVDFTGGNLTPGTNVFALNGAGAQSLRSAGESFTTLTFGGTTVTSLLDAATASGTVTVGAGAIVELNGQVLTLATTGAISTPLAGAGLVRDTPGTGRVDYSTLGAPAGNTYNLPGFNLPSLRTNQAGRTFRNPTAITLTGDLTLAAGNFQNPAALTCSGAVRVGDASTFLVQSALTASSIVNLGTTGTLDAAENAVTIRLTGTGSPLSVATVNGLAGTTLATVDYASAGCTLRSGTTYGNLTLTTGATFQKDAGATPIGVEGDLTFASGAGFQNNTPGNPANFTFSAGTPLRDSTITTSGGTVAFNTLTCAKGLVGSGVGSNLILTDPSPTAGQRSVEDLQLTQGSLDLRASLRVVQGVVGQLLVGDQAELLIATANVELILGDAAGTSRVIQVNDTCQLGSGAAGCSVTFSAAGATGAILRLATPEALARFAGAVSSRLQVRSSTGGLRGFIDAGTTFPAALTPNAGRGVSAVNVSVRDNDASQVISAPSVLRPVLATGSLDLGNTLNWSFEAAPIANAGSDVTVTAASVLLDGSGSSDPGGGGIGYIWSASLGGSPLTTSVFSDAQVVSPTFQPGQSGVFTLTLTVFKLASPGSQASDTVQVNLNSTNNLNPVADAGPDQVGRINTTISLDGSASRDPEGAALTYAWTVVSSPEPVTLSSLTDLRPSFAPTQAGSYVFDLVVSTGGDASPADRITLFVIDDLGTPRSVGPQGVARALGLRQVAHAATLPANFPSATSSLVFADGSAQVISVVDLAGDTGDDPAASALSGLTKVVVYLGGSLFAKLYGADNAASPVTSLRIVDVLGNVQILDVSRFGVAGETFSLDATQSSDDGSISTYSWQQASGPTVFSSTTGATVSVVPPSAGTYRFALTLLDNQGLAGFAQTLDVAILPAGRALPLTEGEPTRGSGPPTAVALITGGATTETQLSSTFARADLGATLSFDASQSVSRGSGVPLINDKLTYAWQQTAGTTTLLTGADQALMTTTPLQAGAYEFELRATDLNQVSSRARVRVTVGAGQSGGAPAAILLAESERVLPESGALTFGLNGAASVDGVLSYLWSQTHGTPTFVDASQAGIGQISITEPGTYVFELRVQDAQGVRSAPAEVSFRVLPAGSSLAGTPGAPGGAATSSSGSKSSGCALEQAPRARGWSYLVLVCALLLVVRRREALLG